MNKDISEKIKYVGINDAKKEIFENQWSLPYGVTYNSYLVIGEKIALIDTAAVTFDNEFLKNIEEHIGDRVVDYLIVNHMEPDHSSLMPLIREKYPDIQIVTNAKAVPMIAGFNGITENIKVIKEGETLDLGGLTLQFHMIPMVHWPETMVTYCIEEKTLFSGDAFGAFGAVKDGITDSSAKIYDEKEEVPAELVNVDTFSAFKDEMARYYACIVGKYGAMVQRALKKLSGLEIEYLCSTHGPVWDKQIGEVIDLYDKMSSYKATEEKGVCIVYGSMYGNTEKAALALAEELKSRDIPYAIHNLTTENPSFAYRDSFKYNILAAGAPTYNTEIFPVVDHYLHGLIARAIKNHKFVSFGSFTWSGGTTKKMDTLMSENNFELLMDGIQFKQGYSAEKIDIKSIADKIEENL